MIDKQSNTPLDYSDNRLWVYFEIGGKHLFDHDYMLGKIDFIEPDQIKEETYGYNLYICNQHIPEVVRVLEKENIGIYQIIRLL